MTQHALPVYLLTGFLGSGKTTFLNAVLKQESFSDTLVIINEFGETGLDHLLVEKSSDTILELSNGCLCCSVRGELIDTLLGIDAPSFKRIMIETTGIADPLPVFRSLASHPEISGKFRPASICTVFDVMRGEAIIGKHGEARRQLAVADVVLLTKTGPDKEPVENARKVIRKYNRPAKILDTSRTGNFSPETLENPKAHRAYPAEEIHNHASIYKSAVLRTSTPLEINTVAGMLHHLSNALGENLLRIKGLVKIACNPEQPMLVQVSGQLVHDFSFLESWPEHMNTTELVLIVQNTSPDMAARIFKGFCGETQIDTPDRAALANNPLSTPGFTT